MKTLVIDGADKLSRVELKGNSVVLHYADKPELTPEIIATIADAPKAQVSQTVSEFFRGIQKKGVVTKLATTTPEQRTAHAQKMNRIRWARRNDKSAAQVENEAAKQIVGNLFEIAKRNDQAKNA